MKTIFIKETEDELSFEDNNGIQGLFQELDKYVDNLINESEVLFDLRNIHYINSLMIGKLIKFNKVLIGNGAKMSVIAGPSVFNVLMNASIGQIFEIEEG